MSGPTIITHGCRLNLAESESITAMLGSGGDALIVVNSCAVTSEAVATARKAIRRAKRDRPDARIVVTGCAAEIDPAMFAGMAEVDAVVPNSAKLDAASYIRPREGRGLATPVWVPAFAGAEKSSGHARHFLPVQNGCDHTCTFCIIPQGRGPNRSIPAGVVIDDIRAALDQGAKEIVLTGVDVTSYGADLPGAPTLGGLVERILRLVPGLPRLRLSSLDPCGIDPRLEGMITREPRVMPHLHLSLQAGDDLTLKRMRRRHTRAQAIALVERLKAARPDLAIGADLIAGFPTESDTMFAGSLALIEECDIVFGHIFPYSPRAGTPAARMPQVDQRVVRERAAILRAASDRRRAAWLGNQIGTVQRVLVELDGATGHAESFAKVRLAGAPNAITPARIVACDGDTLIGIAA